MSEGTQKKRVEVIMTNPYLTGMSILVNEGLYMSQAEIIKDALRRLLLHYKIALVTEEPAAS